MVGYPDFGGSCLCLNVTGGEPLRLLEWPRQQLTNADRFKRNPGAALNLSVSKSALIEFKLLLSLAGRSCNVTPRQVQSSGHDVAAGHTYASLLQGFYNSVLCVA